jgi:hypothetical protein
VLRSHIFPYFSGSMASGDQLSCAWIFLENDATEGEQVSKISIVVYQHLAGR